MGKIYYYYIDYGAGYVEINPHNNELSLNVNREINPYIQRTKLTDSFALISTEAQAAFTYFITGGNFEAPFRIYQNGTISTGTIAYDGYARVKGEYDFEKNTITIQNFNSTDDYTDLLEKYKDEVFGEQAVGVNTFRRFFLLGDSPNCNQLQGYSLSGSTWVTTGNPLSLPNVGRVVVDPLGSGIVVYDNVSKEIRKYVYSAPNWSLSTVGTSYIMPVLAGNGAIASYTATNLAFIDDYFNELYILQETTGTFSVISQTFVENISLPSLASINNSNRIALVDDGTKVLRTYSNSGVQAGETLSLGDISKPQICTLDASNSRIALVDSKTNTLRCYEWSGTIWNEIGANISIPFGYEIKLTQESVNVVTIIIIINATSGYIERYTFSGTSWTQTGSTTNISNGYMAAGAIATSTLGVIQSDTYALTGSTITNYREMLNAMFTQLGLSYTLAASGSGATFDIDKVHIGDLSDVTEINSDPAPINNFKFTLEFMLKLPELFQNYWYVDGTSIKFTQPDAFSSIGTDIDVSQWASVKNQRIYGDEYLYSQEIINFNNERGADFVGLPIDYNRNTDILRETSVNVTTDMGYLVDTLVGFDRNFRPDGLFLIYGTRFLIDSGTGIISTVNEKNYKLSKSQIQDDFWKDYRYVDVGNIKINGSDSAVQNTCRDIIEFPPVNFGLSDVSLTNFPTDIASLDWGGGVKSYCTILKLKLNTNLVTANSILLDL